MGFCFGLCSVLKSQTGSLGFCPSGFGCSCIVWKDFLFGSANIFKCSTPHHLSFLRKGQEWTETWLNANAKIISVDEHLTHAMAEFAKFSKPNDSSGTPPLGTSLKMFSIFLNSELDLTLCKACLSAHRCIFLLCKANGCQGRF